MKKIGFVDYFLNEWHADNYPQWIIDKNRDFEVCYAYGEIDMEGLATNEEWCKTHGIERCATIEELCEKSDYIVILSPDNSEQHLKYAEKVLPFGKPTYIDKTFAPTIADAEKIFELSHKYNCPICSTSALRYAEELKNLGNVENMISVGGGLTYDIYAIHQIEMIVCLMGPNVKRLMAVQNAQTINLVFEFEGGKRASFVQNVHCYDIPFFLLTEHTNVGGTRYTQINSQFFQNFIDGMLDFFDTGKLMATEDETLAVIRLIEKGNIALKNLDQWIEVN